METPPQAIVDAAQIHEFEDHDQAEEFCRFTVSRTGRLYSQWGKVIYTPEGVGCSTALLAEDIHIFLDEAI